MKNKNGFTMLELLIAAAIIGTLALFATQSFRKTAANVRVEEAKARAQMVSAASYRFVLDHPNATLGEDPFSAAVRPARRESCSPTTFTLQNLIDCGYLEYRQYAAEIRDHKADGDTFQRNFVMSTSADASGKVSGDICVRGSSAKILKHDNMHYCYSNGVYIGGYPYIPD